MHRRCNFVPERHDREFRMSEARVRCCHTDIIRIDGYLTQDVYGPLPDRYVIVSLGNLLVCSKSEQSSPGCSAGHARLLALTVYQYVVYRILEKKFGSAAILRAFDP